MKRLIFTIFTLSLLSLPQFVYSQDKPVITLHDMTWADGTRQTFSITEQSAAHVPEWSPEKDDKPPLSISRAITLAKDWARKQYPKENKPDIGTISMRRIKWPEMMNRWFYVIEFSKYLQGYTTDGVPVTGMTKDPTFIVVLMDGTIVRPVISKKR